ncbi:MAG: hypothetical protein HYZ54_12060 [Ignavibacteriae bacterium]|nr:hypothetical protein [Ignavibacteriota bacterium]
MALSVSELSEQLIITVESMLPHIQEGFESYQNSGFTERSPEFFCLELCGEAGELANLEKKKWKGKSIVKELLEDEAADVLIALCNYSNARGINLAKAVASKLRVIETKRARLKSKGKVY